MFAAKKKKVAKSGSPLPTHPLPMLRACLRLQLQEGKFELVSMDN